ncbi:MULTISPECIES: acyl carrier protein [Paenibacillus]|uniref:acyl carrier protein n=1 Tax=Paenibacillus TaxID=44249 RepID=UPI0022B8EB0C|nr:acyl carrier protein [Paenibacillus caseinilyticus]MCZ8520447.1 acyl carrier protein [Paenibacillus caseinilyticus]
MFETIVDILCGIKPEAPELRYEVTMETDLNNDIGLDSLQMIQFMLQVEERIHVAIDYDEFDYIHLQSMEAFIGFLKSCPSSQDAHHDAPVH